MVYPTAATEPLSVRAMQQWTFGLLLRHFFLYVAGVILVDLMTIYSLVLAVVLLLSGLSGDFLGHLLSRIPALIDSPLSNPSASFVLSGAFFALHVAAGWGSALMQRHFSVALETWLRLGVMSNSALWIAPRPSFISTNNLERHVLALAGRARSVVRSGRAMVNILPSIIFLVSAIVSLLILFPAALLWLAAMGVVSVLVQRSANKRVVALEKDFGRITATFKSTLREHVSLYNTTDPDAQELARRHQLDQSVAGFSRNYFMRNTLSRLTHYASFGALTLVSFIFLVALLMTQPQFTEGALVDSFLLLLVVGRTIVAAIAGIATNQAILAKYAVHGQQTFLYFHGPAFNKKPRTILPATRLVGPEPATPYGVGFYLDALNELSDTDLRQRKGSIAWSREDGILVLDPKGQAIPYTIDTVSMDTREPVTLQPGDIFVMYSRALRISKPHRLSPRTYRLILRRDIAAVASRVKRDEALDLDADELLDDDAI